MVGRGVPISPRFATLAGAGAILIWSSLALLTRLAGAVPPLEITALSFSVSAALGLSFIGIRGELGVLRQPPLAWLHGVGGLFGYHALYFAALGLAPVAEANLLNYTWPLLIVLCVLLLLVGVSLCIVASSILGSLLVLLGFAGCEALTVSYIRGTSKRPMSSKDLILGLEMGKNDHRSYNPILARSNNGGDIEAPKLYGL